MWLRLQIVEEYHLQVNNKKNWEAKIILKDELFL